MIDRIGHTIAAVSSAAGAGAVGILRLSGPDACRIAEGLIAVEGGLSALPGSRHRDGRLIIDGNPSLPARVYTFRAPRSFTGEHVVEIFAPGSPPLLAMLRETAVAAGALPALPGEFTARALLHGRMDLSQAQAVAAVISAESDTQLRAARRMMDGALSRGITAVRDELAELLALVEADIDFAEEPIEFITPAELIDRLGRVRERLLAVRRDTRRMERAGVLPRVLLIGPPNAGKSSLTNALSGVDRAICAAVAGTTRDLLSVPIRLGGREAILLDSAGLDESADEIIARARTLALGEAQSVDAIVIVLDVAVPPPPGFAAMIRGLDTPRRIVAANKIDLLAPEERQHSAAGAARVVGVAAGAVAVSAATGEGVEQLRAAIAGILEDGGPTVGAESMVVSERQQRAMDEATLSLDRAIALSAAAAETIDCADLLAFELREALDTLGNVTGEVTTEDLLGQVFARFCIGK